MAVKAGKLRDLRLKYICTLVNLLCVTFLYSLKLNTLFIRPNSDDS